MSNEHPSPREKQNTVPTLHGFFAGAMTAMLACSLFTAVASTGLLTLSLAVGTPQAPWSLLKLLIKGVLFLGLSGALSWGLWRMTRGAGVALPAGERVPGATKGASLLILASTLTVIALILLIGADRYPWAAPDEVHHLTVARNLGEFGLYASGNAEQGFIPFDSYDSVGPPVIGPIAAAIKIWGRSFGASRAVISLYFLGLCLFIYALTAPVLGSFGAIAGVVVMTCGFGSLYLGRTLYGEVPALCFLTGGLWFWRYSIESQRPAGWGIAAGVMFGLAVLSKTIIMITGFAFLAVWFTDILSARRIRWFHMILPGLGGGAVLGAWSMAQALLQHDVPEAAAGIIGMYQHSLMFGLGAVPQALGWMLREPFSLAGLLAGVGFGVWIMIRRRYDPALAVLLTISLLYAYWWIFLTPGRIPRYIWYSYAIWGAFAGGLAWEAVRMTLDARKLPGRRAAALVLALLILTPCALRGATSIRIFWTCDETTDDYTVADYVSSLPSGTPIATTYWPLAGTVNFLNAQTIEIVEGDDAPLDHKGLVLVDTQTQPHVIPNHLLPTLRFGRYAVYGN